jgi:GTP-binding protein HflX
VAERVLLAGFARPGGLAEAETSLDELARLAESAGAEVLGRSLQVRSAPDPATYVGAGKVRELSALAAAQRLDALIFDDELKPSQQRNLEQALGLKVLDRTQLILDVFASRAATNEGRLQVELAQLNYLLPRLTGMGRALSRLGGGIGTRGPGESKLEADRRRLRDRIAALRKEIAQVSRTRSLQRRARRERRVRVAALAGYTNAGKSSLFNALTGSRVYVADRLFATLDPTVRPLAVAGLQTAPRPLLLVDTVGFVRKLPHDLVAAFRATLEEVAQADMLLRVVDAADPDWELQLESVDAVLEEVFRLYACEGRRPESWLIFNKVDRLGPARRRALKQRHPRAYLVSALHGEGMEELKLALRRRLERGLPVQRFLLPHAALGALERHREHLRVTSREWTPEGLRLEAVLGERIAELEPYRLRGAAGGKR